jgi:hypothetical protein
MQYNAALGNAFTEKETWHFVNKHAARRRHCYLAVLLF